MALTCISQRRCISAVWSWRPLSMHGFWCYARTSWLVEALLLDWMMGRLIARLLIQLWSLGFLPNSRWWITRVGFVLQIYNVLNTSKTFYFEMPRLEKNHPGETPVHFLCFGLSDGVSWSEGPIRPMSTKTFTHEATSISRGLLTCFSVWNLLMATGL